MQCHLPTSPDHSSQGSVGGAHRPVFQERQIPVKGAIPLQWGRDLTLAERLVTMFVSVWGAVLQWGRDLTLAERATTLDIWYVDVGFNGAAT